jgi:hypothetical protein
MGHIEGPPCHASRRRANPEGHRARDPIRGNSGVNSSPPASPGVHLAPALRLKKKVDGETSRVDDEYRLVLDLLDAFIPHGPFRPSSGASRRACCGGATFSAE